MLLDALIEVNAAVDHHNIAEAVSTARARVTLTFARLKDSSREEIFKRAKVLCRREVEGHSCRWPVAGCRSATQF